MKYFITLMTGFLVAHGYSASKTELAANNKKRVTASCEYEVNCDCKASGHSVRWEISYCLYNQGIDDTEAPIVQKCAVKLDKEIKAHSDCEKNQYVRSMICLMKHKADDAKFIDCETNYIPNLVRSGAGG